MENEIESYLASLCPSLKNKKSTIMNGKKGINNKKINIKDFEYEPKYRPSEVPRPCFYMLRMLGVWQPPNANVFFHLYTKLIWLVWLSIIVLIFLQNYLHNKKITIAIILNDIGTVANFCCPFVFLRYYFAFGNYERMVSHVYEISSSTEHQRLRKFRYIYTCISLFMWICAFVFFTNHWIPFWDQKWKWTAYIFVLVYTMGWWSVWFSLYGFVCHVHHSQILIYEKQIISTLCALENSNNLEEDKPIARLLFGFSDLQTWLQITQSDFSFIISAAVGYHIADIFVFSFAFFKNQFVDGYPIWDFLGAVLFDLISILIKLYPAAVVCQSLHRTVNTAGDMCLVGSSKKVPYARFEFYQHLWYREQDMGFRILGVKITVRVMIAVFISCGTVFTGFLRLLVSESSLM